jgi:hypothetical protein
MKFPMIVSGFGRGTWGKQFPSNRTFGREALAGEPGGDGRPDLTGMLGAARPAIRLNRDTWAAILGAALFGPLLAQILLMLLAFLGMAVALIANPLLSEAEFRNFAGAFQPFYLGAVAAVASWIVLRTLRRVYVQARVPPVILAYVAGYGALAIIASALFGSDLMSTGGFGAVLGALAAGLAPMPEQD